MESLEADEDQMILVVVGDGDEVTWEVNNGEICSPIKVKEEPMDEEEIMEVIAAAETYGQQVKIQFDSEDNYHEEYENSDLAFEQALMNIKEEGLSDQEENYEEHFVIEDDGDYNYVPSENEEESDKQDSDSETERKVRKKKGRHAMLPVAQRKSFIDDLRQQYPELKKNEKSLIKTVAEIMRNIKPPKLPKDFCSPDPDGSFNCCTCNAETVSYKAAGRHWQEKHGPRYLVCFACGVDFRSKTNLYKHEKRCIAGPDNVIVLKARALFLGRKGRSRPFIPDLSTIPQLKPKKIHKFPCTECSATFSSKVNLTSHENMHRGHRPYCCDKCPSAYTSLSALMRHTQKHSNQVFECDTCHREFKVKTALIAHMDTHNAVPKFGCSYEQCGRRFATKNALNHHVRRQHLRLPMPCACQICPRRYPRMSLLRDHMKKKHGMVLMTRKMFFKALPTLTEEQIQQAKAILKNDAPSINLSADFDRIDQTHWSNEYDSS